MAKEEGFEQSPQEDQVQMHYKQVIENALRGACAAEGGLEIPLKWRGHREVRETVTFGPDTDVEVVVNSQNYDVTMVINGARYQTTNKDQTALLIDQATKYGGGMLRFSDKLSFRTSALAQ